MPSVPDIRAGCPIGRPTAALLGTHSLAARTGDNGRVLMLLDTPSLYFRAFYGIPESVTAPDGMPVNAVRGLIDMMATLVRQHSPDEIAACMDADWRPAFRVAAIPSYKAHRVASGAGAGRARTTGPHN
jgi:5'-3' exonuclease